MPLKVKILRGRGLAVQTRDVRSVRRLPANRPGLYCTCEVLGKPESQIRTLVADNLRHEPVWNYHEEMGGFTRGDSLVVTVYKNGEPSEIVGRVILKSSDIDPDGVHGVVNFTDTAEPRAGIKLWVALAQPDTRSLEHQVMWANKQQRLKLQHHKKQEDERERCIKEEKKQLEERSVHRAASADAAAVDKRFSRLHREAEWRRERLAVKRMAQEKEEQKELLELSIHNSTPPGKAADVTQRLFDRDLRDRSRRAEDRVRRHMRDMEEQIEAAQLSLVEREARRRRQWTEEDLQRMAERMHRGRGRKLCWQPRFPPEARAELLAALFRALDAGVQKRLGIWQMARLADVCGFAGSQGAWEEEYRMICSQYSWNPQVGPDERQLAQMLDDRNGCVYCSDQALQFLLLELGTRTELVAAVFRALSGGRSEPLRSYELRNYADLCGFDGNDAEWVEEYKAVCLDYGWDEQTGADVRQFTQFINDKESTGYRTDNDLHDMLRQLRYRPKMISILFHFFEDPSKRRLGLSELHDFAKLCGFDGDAQEWEEEYRELCAENGWSPGVGADALHFAHLVNDESATAHCTDEQLRDLVRSVESYQVDVRRRGPDGSEGELPSRRASWADGGRAVLPASAPVLPTSVLEKRRGASRSPAASPAGRGDRPAGPRSGVPGARSPVAVRGRQGQAASKKEPTPNR